MADTSVILSDGGEQLSDDANRREQFEAIYAQDQAGLARVAQLYGKHAADDLAQEIAMAIWVALKRFRGDSSLRTFAYRIAHNRGISYLNKRTFETLDEEPVSPERVEESVLVEQRRLQLLDAMSRLPPQTRQVVALSLEGLTYAEIAEVVGISENNVGVTLNRGKQRLQDLVASAQGGVET